MNNNMLTDIEEGNEYSHKKIVEQRRVYINRRISEQIRFENTVRREQKVITEIKRQCEETERAENREVDFDYVMANV